MEVDKNTAVPAPAESWNERVRLETHRSGIFWLHAGVNLAALQPLINRVEDAHLRFSSVPILPEVASRLEKEVVVSSVYGTNTIEAGTLTEEETAAVLTNPRKAREEKELRVVNIKHAYDMAEEYGKKWRQDFKPKGYPQLVLVEDMFTDLHREITQGLTHSDNVPGQYRDNPKERRTQVGDTDHGGIYTPPKCLDDIKLLTKTFIKWANSEPIYNLPPLIRAPLVHYYFERIHPFWDGNGRVGRVVEAMILKAADYQYAPFALSRYYFEHLDRYFTVFNLARKAEEKGEPYPNQVFVEFFLEGMLAVLNHLHDRVNQMIAVLLFESQLRDLHDKGAINDRQYTIVGNLLNKGRTHKLVEVQTQPWYASLYKKLTPKTRSRDLKGLAEKHLIHIGEDGDKTLTLLVPGAR